MNGFLVQFTTYNNPRAWFPTQALADAWAKLNPDKDPVVTASVAIFSRYLRPGWIGGYAVEFETVGTTVQAWFLEQTCADGFAQLNYSQQPLVVEQSASF